MVLHGQVTDAVQDVVQDATGSGLSLSSSSAVMAITIMVVAAVVKITTACGAGKTAPHITY